MTIAVQAGDFDGFFEAPFAIYGRRSPWVTPMRSDLARYLDLRRNPLISQDGGALAFFTARRNGRLVGRITAHRHPSSNVRHGLSRSAFGFLDAVDDAEVVLALLARAEAFARAAGDTEVAGPFNLTAMQQAGLVTEGFVGAPYTDMVWSPPWLPALVEAAGYQPFFPATTFEFDPADVDVEALERSAAGVLTGSDWRFAPINRRTLEARLIEARDCLNAGFDRNPLFVPLTTEEFAFQTGEMAWIMDPTLSAVAHHRGEPAGVLICIPDLNPFIRAADGRLGLGTPLAWLRSRLQPRRAVIVLYSVKPAFQGRGVTTALLHRVVTALRRRGYRRCGVTWIGDGNVASLRMMDKLGARPLHRTQLYRKSLA